MINIPMKVTESYDRNNISSLSRAKVCPALSRQAADSRPQRASGTAAAGAFSAQTSRTAASGTRAAQGTSAPRTPQAPQTPPPAAAPYRKPPALRNLIQKGQKVSVGAAGQLKHLRIAMGWNTSDSRCDIDLSAFLLDASGKVPGDDWFVFYGQAKSPDGSVSLNTDGSAEDRETADIDLARLNPGIKKIVFVLTINEAFTYHLNFSMVKDAYIRLLEPDTSRELYSFRLTDYYANVTSMMLGELYLYNGTWKFNAVGNGVAKDLEGLCGLYGVQTN